MRYCPACAHEVEQRIPAGDNRLRHCCPSCGAIHYQNPRMVLGTIPTWQGRILLCRRAIEPRYGYWTLPAGFMENGESVGQGALRETLEEAGARVELGAAYSMISVPRVNQVHVFFLARILDLDAKPGAETLEIHFYDEAEIPWKEIAFRTVAMTLRYWFADRAAGRQGFHVAEIAA